MTVFDALTMIGGLCLFLFGMNVMGDGLERRAGNSLKALLGKLTNSKLKGFLTGLGVTAVIQSSSATTVMVVFLYSLQRPRLSLTRVLMVSVPAVASASEVQVLPV